MKKTALSIAIALLVSSPAFAQSGTFDASVGGVTFNDQQFIGAIGRLGYTVPIFDDVFAIGVEADAGFGLAGIESFPAEVIADEFGNQYLLAFDIDEKVKESFGGYLVARTSTTKQFGVIGRVGYHSSRYTADVFSRVVDSTLPLSEVSSELTTGTTENFDLKFKGLSAGVGIEYFFSKKNGVRLDATFVDTGDLDNDQGGTWTSIVYVRRF